MQSPLRIVVKLGVALVAAAAAGALTGGLARALMRAATLVTGGIPEFSWAATIGIMMVFAIAMVPAAGLAAFTVQWWRWLAGAAGSFLLAAMAALIAQGDLAESIISSRSQWVVVVEVVVAIFAAIAAAPIVTVRLVDTMLGRRIVARVASSVA